MKNDSQQSHLVIGGDGILGRGIAGNLSFLGRPFFTTSRDTRKLTDRCFFLDMEEDPASFEIPTGVSVATICIAETSLARCAEKPQQTAKINVTGTLQLAEKLSSAGIHIIFPSTNMVFDGSVPWAKADSPSSPRAEYGRQKAEVEGQLLAMIDSLAIVRLSKIFHYGIGLLNDWINNLQNNQPIYPFTDMVVSPIPLSLATELICKLCAEGRCGIWQLSAVEDISYARLAGYIAEKLGAKGDCIQPKNVPAGMQEFDLVPKYTTLDTSRVEDELGLLAPSPFMAIDLILTDYFDKGINKL